MGEYLVYGLVFAAVITGLWVVWTMTDAAGMAEGEKRDFENNVRADGRQKTPLERFVSPGRLFRLQLAFAMFPGLIVPGCFLMAGITEPAFLVAFGAAFASAGWKLVRFRFNRLVRKRQAMFETRILDLTSGLANALKAGMAFPQALERISARMDGPMREELEIVLREYRLGIEMPVALERLVERMPCEDMRLLTASVRLTTQTGGSLADVLGEMTDMIRGRREFAEKVKTLTAQGRFEGLAMGAMPIFAFVIFYFLQPDVMSSLFTTLIGWVAIGVVVVLETIGFIVISKITTIEV